MGRLSDNNQFFFLIYYKKNINLWQHYRTLYSLEIDGVYYKLTRNDCSIVHIEQKGNYFITAIIIFHHYKLKHSEQSNFAKHLQCQFIVWYCSYEIFKFLQKGLRLEFL